MDPIPTLRPGVLFERAPSGRGTLVDPAFGARIGLDPRGSEIVAALDAPQSLADLAERVGAEPAALVRILGNFDRYHLLDTPAAREAADSASATAKHRDASPDALPLLIRDDARFTCTMCGSCCGGHTVGPVMEDTIVALEPVMDALAARTGSEKGLFFALPHELGTAPDGGRALACHASGGSCVFLDDAGKCVIHADYGAEKKPRACRLFPYQFVATPDGVAVTISQECRGFAEARQGKRLRDDEAALRALLRLVPNRSTVPNRLRLDASTLLTWPDYGALEADLHAAVDASADHASTLASLRGVLVERGAEVRADARDVTALRADLDQLCGMFGRFCGQLGAELGESTERHVVHVESLALVADALGNLRADWGRVVRPLRRPDQRALFRDGLHHELMSKAWLGGPNVVAEFARWAFGWCLARALMIGRARAVKRRHLVAQDVMDAVVALRFVFRNEVLGDVMTPLAPAIESLFFHRLDALLDAGDALPDRDTRTELYRF